LRKARANCPYLEDMDIHLREQRGPHTPNNHPRGQASSMLPEQGLTHDTRQDMPQKAEAGSPGHTQAQ